MENSYKLIENLINQDFKINNYEFHCPECLQNALFGIKNKENKIYINYKCRIEHKGENLLKILYKHKNIQLILYVVMNLKI